MAKFAIALCILLAVCGTQASLWDEIYAQVQEKVEDVKAAIEEKKQQLGEKLDFLKDEFEIRKQKVQEKVQSVKDAIDAKLEEALANAGEAKACLDLSVDIRASLEAISYNTLECSRNVVAENEAKYQEMLESFEVLTDDLADILGQAENCKNDNNNLMGAASCLWKLLNNEAKQALEKWAALSEDIIVFLASLEGVNQKLQECGRSEYVSTATSEVQESWAKFQDCINNENYVAY